MKGVRSIDHISTNYDVPKSTLYYFMKNWKENDKLNESKLNVFDWPIGLSQNEIKWLKLNIIPPQYPLTINKLDSKMSEVFYTRNRKQKIKFYLKRQMKYSYKKGSSMLKIGSNERNLVQQSIFSSRALLDICKENTLLILMNQVFNRSLKNNYSWLPIGIPSSIININSKGRWSIIAAIWSDGEFIIQIVNSTTNSEIFQEFICILNYALKFVMKSETKNIYFIMDNATIHTCEKTKKLFTKFKNIVKYLPPYSPKLAPVELFFNIVKQKIRMKNSEEYIDFDKQWGKNCIYFSVDSILKSHIKALWLVFVNQARICINKYAIE